MRAKVQGSFYLFIQYYYGLLLFIQKYVWNILLWQISKRSLFLHSCTIIIITRFGIKYTVVCYRISVHV